MTPRFRIGLLLLIGVFWSAAGRCDTQAPSLVFGFAIEGYPIQENHLRSVICETAIVPHIVMFYLQWQHPKGREPMLRPSLEAIWSMGAVPCITWEPMRIVDGKEVVIHHRDITRGDYDDYLTDVARHIQAFNRPILIRFAHEMNLKRYHWGTEETGYGPNSPEIYRNLFRHVVGVFRKAGVSNVRWVFCPNADSVPNPDTDPSAGWNVILAYYPGDEWVDVLGIDGYNWGDTQRNEKHGWNSSWRSFEHLFAEPVRQLRKLSSKKPILVFETACAASGGDKGVWIREAFQTAQTWDIQGIVWFQVNKEVDWRLQSGMTSEALAWLRATISPSHRWMERSLEPISK